MRVAHYTHGETNEPRVAEGYVTRAGLYMGYAHVWGLSYYYCVRINS